MNWTESFRQNKFKIEFIITISLLALTLIALAKFIIFVEIRNGVVLNDPILNLFEPVDLTWVTFGLIYISLIAATLHFLKNPELLLRALQAYILMVILRIIAMSLVPLSPPDKIIPLSDPFTEFFGTGQLITKDLFFSGHTATIYLFFLLAEKKFLRVIFLIASVLVALCVLLQHVHYSIDVFAAPFFAYCSFILVKKFRSKYK